MRIVLADDPPRCYSFKETIYSILYDGVFNPLLTWYY